MWLHLTARTSEKRNLAWQPHTKLQFYYFQRAGSRCWQTNHSPCHITLSEVPSHTSQRLLVPAQSGEVYSEVSRRLSRHELHSILPFSTYLKNSPRISWVYRFIYLGENVQVYFFFLLSWLWKWTRWPDYISLKSTCLILPVLMRRNWCFNPSLTLFQQRQSCWAESPRCRFSCPMSGWDRIINESRQLARYTGSLRAEL